ncbi:lipoprotein [Rhodococcus gordoniae]|uniref:Lipoprotein n=1 Tax=Rhodococcus gordoniae TaxID=223392 RepID=A0A379M1Q0_9NOCA|nr:MULTISPECIES: hypothetical protein [Rhodococcus]UTT50772.1 hypothetical protein NMQ04_17300 [Rhodococcus gordoniae]SUE15325.1 lipoprotein [Rhodococcus gordoniae]
MWPVAVVTGAALFVAGCGGSADGPEADSGATSTTTSAAASTTSSTTVAPSTTEETTPSTTEPAPEPETSPEEPAPLAQVEYQRNESYYFSSPDGTFECGIVRLPTRTEAGCEGPTDPIPPRPEDCMVNWGLGIRVQDSGEGEFVCSGGPVYLSPDGASPTLPPGSSLSQLGYTCAATAADVTCTNDATGHGFRVAAGSNETF